MTPRVEPYGPNALLVRFSNQADDDAHGWAQSVLRHFETRPLHGLQEVTPGFTTVLLEFRPGMRPEPSGLVTLLKGLLHHPAATGTPLRILEIPIVYDGPDLERVAAHGGLETGEVVRLHAATTYRVRILGFSPGFPYLSGLDRRLHVPRLATPRPEVPAGSVAIGGEHTGIYPVATAGGWNLIGRTAALLMDPQRAARGEGQAFLLHPGDGVRFVPVDTISAAGVEVREVTPP